VNFAKGGISGHDFETRDSHKCYQAVQPKLGQLRHLEIITYYMSTRSKANL
jgi:hypothetical protein